MGLKRWIEVSFQKEGIHKYPAALTDERLKDVEFLGYPHRHMFHFYVRLEVFHNDRDVEFILFRRELEGCFKEHIIKIDYMSCEMLAEEVIYYIQGNYHGRDIIVKVFEDDENGAVIEYKQEQDLDSSD